tara:strand:- start:3971 stop:6769 length:2799 start_codon:yes stop_codon:yes gene_type:complete
MNDARGSIWRKWDLHVHTPESVINGYGNSDNVWEDYITDLEALPEEFKVLGINDYLFLDGYDKLKNEKENNNRLNNIDLLLPVVEFRINKFAGVEFRNTKRINLHVIFSDELQINTIKSQFLNALEQSYAVAPGVNPEFWAGSINYESLKDLGKAIKSSVPTEKLPDYSSDLIEGFNNLNLDEEKIFELLKKPYFKDKYLVAIGKTEWDELQWTDGSIAEKKGIINKAHLVFTSAESVERYVKAQKKLTEQNVNNLLFDCSDAHSFSYQTEIKDRIGNCFNWVKGDTTFEGLRQVIFEEFERLRIQDSNPQWAYPKPYFSEISIQSTGIFGNNGVKFDGKELPLNPNLVAIIGGRGTGKSLLLDAIAKTFNKTRINKRAEKVTIAKNDFKINYKKHDNSIVKYSIQDTNNLDYLHIHQGEVKDIADPENPEKLDSEIKSLLKLPSYDEIQTDFPDSTIEKLINEIFDIKDWFRFKDEEGNFPNTTEFNERKKKENEDLIGTITTKENKDLIQKYIQNLNNVNEAGQHIISAGTTNEGLNDFQMFYNEDIAALNELIEEADKKIPAIEFKPQTDAIESFIETKKVKIASLKTDNAEIEKSFEEAGIKGDISTLLEQLEIYQREINILNKKIEEAKSKQKELDQKFIKIGEIAVSIAKCQQTYILTIQSKWQRLKQGKDDWNEEQEELISQLLKDIEIEAVERFVPKVFYDLISEFLNLQKFRQTQIQTRNERLLETFNINDQESFKSFLKGEKIVTVNGEEKIGLAYLLDTDFFVRDGSREFLRVCLLSRYREKFWKVLSSSKYKKKEIYQLSVGQRGTFYVCLKLATDPFLKPFVFDQPEDDLDNDFIMHHLVPIFKKIKKYRQVIIVTHNANLVVNADAEQVVIAFNEDETLKYVSGGIENIVIRDQICNILEGGKDAFIKREQKYGFVNI